MDAKSDDPLALAKQSLLCCDGTKYSRTLVIYTGGTFGMTNDGNKGYAPSPKNLERLLRGMPIFHQPPSYATVGGSALKEQIFLNEVVDSEGNEVITPALVTPASILRRRVAYSIIEFPVLLDSSNMTSKDWVAIATAIEQNYNRFDAFVVLHGTDTMAYTASALSFLLENLGKPVVLTGAQIPLHEWRNDAVGNLLGALAVVGHHRIPEVCVYFHHQLFRGNRCRKVDSVGFDSFATQNCPVLASLSVHMQVAWDIIREPPPSGTDLVVHKSFEDNVVAVRVFPNITGDFLRRVLAAPTRGAVIETYGAGNAPNNRPDVLQALRDASCAGIVIVNVTQCSRGFATDSYATGRSLAQCGVVSGGDMTTECALAKLGFLLAQNGDNPDLVRRMIAVPLRSEITLRTRTRSIPTPPPPAATHAQQEQTHHKQEVQSQSNKIPRPNCCTPVVDCDARHAFKNIQ